MVAGSWRSSACARETPKRLRIDWRATGGTVSSTGLYKAPSTAGTYRVIAQRSGDVLADTAIVTVGGSGGGTGSGLVGECQRARPEWIWCDDFEQDRLSRYFEVQQLSSGRFTRQNGVGNGGSYGMRSIFNTTPQTSAGSLMLAFGRTPQAYFRPVDAGTKNYREVYFRVYVKHPANWQGGGGEKLMRATSFVSSSSWAQSMIAHVWGGGYAAGYYAYLWTQMLADNSYQWFEQHGGMTRANGQRFRDMILSRGHTEDYGPMFRAFYGKDPEIGPMLEHRGLGEAQGK